MYSNIKVMGASDMCSQPRSSLSSIFLFCSTLISDKIGTQNLFYTSWPFVPAQICCLYAINSTPFHTRNNGYTRVKSTSFALTPKNDPLLPGSLFVRSQQLSTEPLTGYRQNTVCASSLL